MHSCSFERYLTIRLDAPRIRDDCVRKNAALARVFNANQMLLFVNKTNEDQSSSDFFTKSVRATK